MQTNNTATLANRLECFNLMSLNNLIRRGKLLTWKYFPEADTLAYFYPQSLTKKKSFITLSPRCLSLKSFCCSSCCCSCCCWSCCCCSCCCCSSCCCCCDWTVFCSDWAASTAGFLTMTIFCCWNACFKRATEADSLWAGVGFPGCCGSVLAASTVVVAWPWRGCSVDGWCWALT